MTRPHSWLILPPPPPTVLGTSISRGLRMWSRPIVFSKDKPSTNCERASRGPSGSKAAKPISRSALPLPQTTATTAVGSTPAVERNDADFGVEEPGVPVVRPLAPREEGVRRCRGWRGVLKESPVDKLDLKIAAKEDDDDAAVTALDGPTPLEGTEKKLARVKEDEETAAAASEPVIPDRPDMREKDKEEEEEKGCSLEEEEEKGGGLEEEKG